MERHDQRRLDAIVVGLEWSMAYADSKRAYLVHQICLITQWRRAYENRMLSKA